MEASRADVYRPAFLPAQVRRNAHPERVQCPAARRSRPSPARDRYSAHRDGNVAAGTRHTVAPRTRGAGMSSRAAKRIAWALTALSVLVAAVLPLIPPGSLAHGRLPLHPFLSGSVPASLL